MNHDYLNNNNFDTTDKIPDGVYQGDIDGLNIDEKNDIERLTIKLKICSDKFKNRVVFYNLTIPKADDQYFDLRCKELIKVMKLIHPNCKELGKWIDNKNYQELIDQTVEFQLKTNAKGYQNVSINKLIKFDNTQQGENINYDPFA